MKYKVLSTTGSTRGTAYTMSNKILTHQGKTHVVWLDQIRKTYVRTYHHATRRWSRPVFVGEGDDNHAGAALAMDSKGYLHLAFGPHVHPIQHAVSRRPNSTASWVMQPTFGGPAATYPSMVCDAEDTLHVCYRGSFEGERPLKLMYQRRPKGGAWSAPVMLVDPEGPQAYTQFGNALFVGPDGVLYLAYHIVRATEADLARVRGMGFGMMRSRDGGTTWETAGGEPLVLPTTPRSPCVLAFDPGLDVRVGNPACDGQGNPFFTLNRHEGAVSEAFLYRWRSGRWHPVSLLSQAEKLAGPCAMPDACSLTISDEGVVYVSGIVCRRGGGWADPTTEVVLFTSRNAGETFSAYRVSPEDPSVSNWLPALEHQTGHNGVEVPHLAYTHGEGGKGCSPDVSTEIRFVSLNSTVRAEERAVEEAISGYEKLGGLAFTEAQRRGMRRRVETNRMRFRRLREVAVGYEVEPPTVFLPGTGSLPRGERKPFSWMSGEVPGRPDTDTDLAFLPVTALARLVASRQVSPVELTRVYLDRLRAHGDALRCVVSRTEDLALSQAQAAEAEIAAGHYRGPLHGIPWGAKDLLATRGIRTTWGATPFEQQVIDADATVVERLREAGAVLVAKLSMGALAMGPHWFGGTTRCPWNPQENSSGSSAGPGAATAAGLVGFSIGSETLGSIVSPSHRCGVVGLRPTYGRVSRHGAMALSWTMDKLGPMCRGVEDCAAVLSAIYGPDGKDRSVTDVPFTWPPEGSLNALRIGYLASEFEAVRDPAARAVDRAALDVLRGLGARLEPISMPAYPYDAIQMVLTVEAAAAFDELTRRGGLDIMKERDRSGWPDAFRAARTVPAVEYLRAQRVRTLLVRDLEALMAQWDVVLAPAGGGQSLTATNLAGQPAVTLPCGFVAGMPRGLTFIGPLYGEATALSAALAYERATEWHLRHPSL